jgi:hypothetical protein
LQVDPVNEFDLTGQCAGPAIALLPGCVYILNEIVVSLGGAGGSGSWSKGLPRDRDLNMLGHTNKHQIEVGVSDFKAYTKSAWNVVHAPTAVHTYQKGAKTAYRNAKGYVTVVKNKANGARKLVTHFRPKNINQYWKDNILTR